MKNRIYIGMLGLLLALASCSQSEELPQNNDGKQLVTFTAQPDYGLNTRAVSGDNDAIPTRAFMVVYEENSDEGELIDANEINADGSFSLSIELETTQKYNCYFWADGGDYDVADLAAITYGAGDANTQPSIAFSARLTDFSPSSAAASVSLKHAVAKIALNETGTLNEGDRIGISFDRPDYAYNLKEGTYTTEGGTTQITLQHTVAASATSGILLSTYLLAPAEEAMMVDGVTLSYTAANGGYECPKTLSNVPFRANYRTVFTGHFPDLDVYTTHSFSVSMSPDWEGDEDTFFIGADAVTHTIVNVAAGLITEDMITTALAGGNELNIAGPMNAKDFATIQTYMKSHQDARLELDLSAVTGLTEIPERAFYITAGDYSQRNLALASIVLPEGVTSIGARAFMYCNNLSSVELPTSLKSIGVNAFYAEEYGKGLQGSLTIPEGVTSVGAYFLGKTGITELTLPASLTSFAANNVFATMSELTSIVFKGDATEFGYSPFGSCNALRSIDLSKCTNVPNITLSPELFFNNITNPKAISITVPANLVSGFQAAEGWNNATIVAATAE